MNEPVTEAYGSLNSIEQLKQAMYDPMGKPVVINGIPDNYVPQKTEENALKNKVEDVLSVIFIIYFIAAIVGGMGLGEYDKLLGIACFGSLFLVVGLIVTFKTIGAGMNPLVLLFPYIGALMTGIPIYNIYCLRSWCGSDSILHNESFQENGKMLRDRRCKMHLPELPDKARTRCRRPQPQLQDIFPHMAVREKRYCLCDERIQLVEL